MKKLFMNLWVYAYPFPACYFFYQYWKIALNEHFALFMILAPLLYGYIIPGIGTNVLKKWKFNTPFRLGNYYAHHGFKISGNMNTWFFLASLASAPFLDLNNAEVAGLCISTGAVMGFFTWWHDTELIRLGKLELHNVLVTPNMSPEEKAYSYCPPCFFAMGASYAFSAIVAFRYFAAHPEAGTKEAIIAGFLGYLVIATLGSIVFGILEMKARRRTKTKI